MDWDWNNRNVCLSVFLQFRLAGWLAEVLRRWCFSVFVCFLKATSSSSGICTFIFLLKSRKCASILSHLCSKRQVVCLASADGIWTKSFLLLGYKSMGSDSKTESVVPFTGVLVTGNLSTLSLLGFHGASDMSPASSLQTSRKVFFHSPTHRLLLRVSSANQSNPHFPTLHLCVCVFTYTHSVDEKGEEEEEVPQGGECGGWVWLLLKLLQYGLFLHRLLRGPVGPHVLQLVGATLITVLDWRLHASITISPSVISHYLIKLYKAWSGTWFQLE